jgi:hypothetical protein
LAVSFASFAFISAASAAIRLEPVMLAGPMLIGGDPAPGTGGLTFGAALGWPYINNQSEVAFQAFINGGGDADYGLWVGKRNDLQLVVREGQHTPDGSGLHFNTVSGFQLQGLAKERNVLFQGYLELTDPGVTIHTDESVWMGAPNDQQQVFRAQEFSQVPLFYFTQDGHVGSGWNTYGEPPNVDPVLPPNYPAPGAGDDVFLNVLVDAMNDAGRMSVTGDVIDPEQPCNYCSRGVWLIDPNAPVQVTKIAVGALTGDEGITPADAAPGTGESFVEFLSNTINNQDRVALLARISAPTNQFGIWTWDAGQMDLLVREGDPAPISGQSLTIANFTAEPFVTYAPQLNGKNEVMFLAQLEGPGVDTTNDRAMFIGDSAANLRAFAREGDPAPGLDDGIVFEKFSRFDNGPYNEPALNARGQVVFPAILTGPGVDTSNDNSWWLTRPDGRIVLVAREGDLMELEPGVSGIVNSLDVAPALGGQDGRGLALNDRGQLVFTVGFRDGISAIVIATIPEPSTLPLLMLAAAHGMRLRRRQTTSTAKKTIG